MQWKRPPIEALKCAVTPERESHARAVACLGTPAEKKRPEGYPPGRLDRRVYGLSNVLRPTSVVHEQSQKNNDRERNPYQPQSAFTKAHDDLSIVSCIVQIIRTLFGVPLHGFHRSVNLCRAYCLCSEQTSGFTNSGITKDRDHAFK